MHIFCIGHTSKIQNVQNAFPQRVSSPSVLSHPLPLPEDPDAKSLLYPSRDFCIIFTCISSCPNRSLLCPRSVFAFSLNTRLEDGFLLVQSVFFFFIVVVVGFVFFFFFFFPALPDLGVPRGVSAVGTPDPSRPAPGQRSNLHSGPVHCSQILNPLCYSRNSIWHLKKLYFVLCMDIWASVYPVLTVRQ